MKKVNGKEDLELWFGLSYASFLTLPRAFMNQMPDEWQGRMAKLLNEYNMAFNQDVELDGSVVVMIEKEILPDCECEFDGECEVCSDEQFEYSKPPEFICNYRRPDVDKIKSLMRK